MVKRVSNGEGGVGDNGKCFVFWCSCIKEPLSDVKCLLMQGPAEALIFSKAGSYNWVLCGLKREACVGTWCWVTSGPPLSVGLFLSSPAPLSPQRKGGGVPTCLPSQWKRETSHSVFPQDHWCCCRRTLWFFKQIKTSFKKSERIWQAEESLNPCWRVWTL